MMRRRPVARLAVGTAVVAGTAGAVSGHMANKQQQQAAAQQAAAPPEAPAEAPAEDPYAQLERQSESGMPASLQEPDLHETVLNERVC